MQPDYILEHESEADRLEKQAEQKHYSITDELKNIDLSNVKTFLDAGCGTGLLSRHIQEQNPLIKTFGIDQSELRIQQAKKLSPGTNFVNGNLEDLPFVDPSFDLVISRYVYEYLKDPIAVTKSLANALSPDGTLCLIDLDGIFYNIYSGNPKLDFLLSKVKNKLSEDFFVGRKLLTSKGCRVKRC